MNPLKNIDGNKMQMNRQRELTVGVSQHGTLYE